MKQKILCGIDGFEQGTAELLDYIQTIVQTERNNNGNFFRFCSHLALTFEFASFKYIVSGKGGINKTNRQNSNFSIFKSNQRKELRYQMVISTRGMLY